jgi:hypothetical protein
MNFKEILNERNITVSVGLNDLREFAKDIVQQTKKELEDSVVAQKSETYLTRRRTSELLDVDLSTLWRWARQNYLVPVCVGGKKRYKMSDINGLLNR